MISFRNPWKNSWTIRLVAAVDIAFACLLVSVYLQKLITPIYYESTHIENPRVPSLKLFLLAPIIFNSFQIVMSFNLFSAARRGNEPVISYAKACTWMQFSTVMLAFLVLKLFLVLWFPPHGSISRKDIFGATLTVLETVFKIFGIFVVKEFIDDLKCVLSMLPVPQFYCVYSASTPFPAADNAGINPGVYSNYNINTSYPCQNSTQVPQPQPGPSTETSTTQTKQNRNSVIITTV